MDKSREELKRQCDILQETVIRAGLADSAVFDEQTMKVRFGNWTPDGIAFRNAVLKAYDTMTKRKAENPLKDLCGLVMFIAHER